MNIYTFGDTVSLRLTSEIILSAVDSFTKGILQDGVIIGGHVPKAIALHSWIVDPESALPQFREKYRHLAKELAPALETLRAKGIEIKADAGILSWQIAIGETDHNVIKTYDNTPAKIESLGPVQIADDVIISPEGKILPSHRPRLFGVSVDSLISALESEGLGARLIHATLTGQGIKISLPSVSRRLRAIKEAEAMPR